MSLAKRTPAHEARRLVFLALFLAITLHGGLLPFTLGQTYDAHIHMFFGDHYHRSWFDPWEPRWYTGFTVTAYPPGSHQLIGLLLYLAPHKAAFIIVQVLAVLILVLGVYRFSRLWVSDMAAALASLLCVSSTAIAETVHIFGQLPTTLSLGIFLNATPHIYAWIREGRKQDIPFALILTAGATAAHHVTPIFATLLFVVPLGLRAWSASLPQGTSLFAPSSWPPSPQFTAAPIRGVSLGLMMLLVIILVVFPYWHWSVTDPITQVSIPHGSRESFIEYPNFGLMFFIIPWGPLLAIIPYVIWCVFRTPLWPLALSVLICLLLGTGGTTPLPRLIFGSAFDILTLDRFTFWAVIMTLPFAGAALVSLLSGSARRVLNAALGQAVTQVALAALVIAYALTGVMVAALPLVKPTQPAPLDPDPIVQFMARDDHNRWRYLTLGFGDQFAYHSALIDGLSVDGNYHSARRLPHLTAYSVERLENSKYLGLPGLSALKQIITNAEMYNLKYIFSNDAFYDPLLYFGGWTRLQRLRNGVVVWEKVGVSPIEFALPRQTLAPYKTIMWGIIPPTSLLLVFAALFGLAITGQLIPIQAHGRAPQAPRTPNPKTVLIMRYTSLTLAGIAFALAAIISLRPHAQDNAEATLEQYYTDLDLRDFKAAYDKLVPGIRPDSQTYLKTLRNRGGLIGSYAKLADIKMASHTLSPTKTQIKTTRTYLSALGTQDVESTETLILTEGGWRVKDPITPKTLTHALTTREIEAASQDLSVTRMPMRGTGAASLDRPRITASEPVLVNLGPRLKVVGAVTNTATYPACLDITAKAQFGKNQSVLQHMGDLGSHRLSPSETRHYSIEFEGLLDLQDNPAAQGTPAKGFRLPTFSTDPEAVEVRVATFPCPTSSMPGLIIDNVDTTNPDSLGVTLTNHGTRVADIVRLSLTYFDAQGRAILIAPYYLEANLIPGEIRTETVPLYMAEPVRVVRVLDQPLVNGQDYEHEPEAASIKLPLDPSSSFAAVSIELDAMPFAPTR
jgi:hypothetical protein